MSIQVHQHGILREFGNDDTRTYTIWDENGEIISSRPYTNAENIAADDNAVFATQTSNKSTIEVNLEEDLDMMQLIIDTDNSVINDSPAAYIKDIARSNRRLIKMALEDFEEAE